MLNFKEFSELKEEVIGGTFVGVKFAPETIDGLINYISKYNISNSIDKGKIHSTLIFSTNELIDFDTIDYDVVIEAKPKGFSVWDVDEGDHYVLVLKIISEYMVRRHEEIMKDHPEATYNFPQYIPHITLSYDIDKNFDVTVLPFNELPRILITKEYQQEIESDFGKQKNENI